MERHAMEREKAQRYWGLFRLFPPILRHAPRLILDGFRDHEVTAGKAIFGYGTNASAKFGGNRLEACSPGRFAKSSCCASQAHSMQRRKNVRPKNGGDPIRQWPLHRRDAGLRPACASPCAVARLGLHDNEKLRWGQSKAQIPFA